MSSLKLVFCLTFFDRLLVKMENEACEERAALFGAEAMLHSYIVSYRLPLEVARASGPEDGKFYIFEPLYIAKISILT